MQRDAQYCIKAEKIIFKKRMDYFRSDMYAQSNCTYCML